MTHTPSHYPIENGWLFGFKWSAVGVVASLLMLGGCSLFDVDENKERHNKVYGERKVPQLNPQAPRPTKQAESHAAQQLNAELDAVPAPVELTPFDQYHSQEAVDMAPPPVAPPSVLPVASTVPVEPLAPKVEVEPEVVARKEKLYPLPEVAVQRRNIPKENQEILGVQELAAPAFEEPYQYNAPVATMAPIIDADPENVTFEPPMIKKRSALDTMPLKELEPVAAAEIAPAYNPPSAQPQYTPPALAPEPDYAMPVASAPVIVPAPGMLGSLTYNAQGATPSEPVVATEAEPVYVYQPYQGALPVTAVAPAPTPVGPLTLNAPEEALASERYLPASRYTMRRTMNRRVNAY